MSSLLKFYFSFQGRATRYDFNVRYALVALIGMILAAILDITIANDGQFSMDMIEPFSNFWNVVLIVPTFAIVCKRLHDLGYSGWWQMLIHGFTVALVVIIALTFGMSFILNPMVVGMSGAVAIGLLGIFYIVFFLALSMKRGTKGPNRYGVDPLEVASNDGK